MGDFTTGIGNSEGTGLVRHKEIGGVKDDHRVQKMENTILMENTWFKRKGK